MKKWTPKTQKFRLRYFPEKSSFKLIKQKKTRNFLENKVSKRNKNQENRHSLESKNHSKLKDNERLNDGFRRKKSEETHSPNTNKKITDFFSKAHTYIPEKRSMISCSTLRNSENSKKSKNNSKFRTIDNSLSNMNRIENNCSSSYGMKREIKFENLKLKEEIRKLNKIMVDKEGMIKNNEQKIENLIVSNQNHRENLKNVEDLEKVLLSVLKGKSEVF